LEVTILDPELDPGGNYAAGFVDLLLAAQISGEAGSP
jgi:hypothetical protein